MSTLWPHTHESLHNSLGRLSESLGRLRAANSVDIQLVIDQLNTAAEAVRNLHSLVRVVLPEATWRNREEYDEVVKNVERILAARSRLLALATELEGGDIVHRRALRVDQLNRLRDQAVIELRCCAELPGATPDLPGPDADEWIEWAVDLTESEDSKSLQALREGFARLDAFVANLEPDMWIAKTEAEV